MNFLIDPSGKVVEQDMDAERLEVFLNNLK